MVKPILPPAFRPVHRRIGGFEQAVWVTAVGGERGRSRAEAKAKAQLMLRVLCRLLSEPAKEILGLRKWGAGQQHGKLVTPLAGDGVRLARL